MSAKNFEQVRSDYLQTLKTHDASAHVHVGSDNHVRASAFAAVAEGQYQHQEWILDQAFADTANSAYLERHAAHYAIYRKPATVASGKVQLQGNPGTLFPAETLLAIDGTSYLTTAACYITAAGTGVAHTVCVSAGTVGNQSVNTKLKVSSTPAGGKSEAMIVSMVGGTNVETDQALLARYLERLRRPPAGGNRYDYRNWCLEVKGVVDAYVYPLRRGNGFVDAVILGENGIPSTETLTAVQSYVDLMRPVTRKNGFLAIAPTIQTVNIDVVIKANGSIDNAALQADVKASINTYFKTLMPSDTLVKSQLETAISNVYGVADRTVNQPAGNVQADITERDVFWLRPGSITVTLL